MFYPEQDLSESKIDRIKNQTLRLPGMTIHAEVIEAAKVLHIRLFH